MKTARLLIPAALLGALLAGCTEGGENLTKDQAEEKIFAPTDVNNMSSDMKSKIPANGLGPAGGSGGQQPGPGATAPPSAGGAAAPR